MPKHYIRIHHLSGETIIDCPSCVLTARVDTSLYITSCTKSVDFSASLVMLALKSAKVGNADDAGANVGNADAERSTDQ